MTSVWVGGPALLLLIAVLIMQELLHAWDAPLARQVQRPARLAVLALGSLVGLILLIKLFG